MKYTVLRMDKRFTHHDLFEYCIKFSTSMTQNHGPLKFNDALRWFVDTYGWSAEIRQYDKMVRWVHQTHTISSGWVTAKNSLIQQATGILSEVPDHCNPHWSWTNGYDDLRIYVRSSAELNFFQLRWPNEQR